MTSIKYDDIFSFFLAKVKDFDFLRLDEPEVYDLLAEKLHMAISVPYVRRLYTTVTLNNDERILDYELKYPIEPNYDLDFSLDILSEQMVVEWFKPILNNKVNLSQMFSTKEVKYFSQAQHLSELRAFIHEAEERVRRKISDRGLYNNPYIDNARI